ncbi:MULTISPECIES: pre-toxin TG domain-containing protein [unclassified Streptomyces]|uniref:pre-toxin TG domain-containing protein n=2 Tax=Streptomyces TaxID=1883 RepID=UPI000938B5CD|nr:pre-toxin TG domain-containing protein [Streptomyces sp. TSRI0107]OKJ75934.1 hypothetical protein AMK31_29975 [Streptomyces sp. TSRI0107]
MTTPPAVASPVAGDVSRTLAYFEHAVGLARGTREIRDRARPTVPYADMVAAHEIAVEVRQRVRAWHARASMTRWPAFVAFGAQGLVDAAASAASRFEVETRLLAERGREGGEVPSARGGWPPVWVRSMNAAREPLEIIAGERAAADGDLAIASELTYEEIHDHLLFVPVVGEVVLALDVISGRNVISWRRLSATERALAALGIVLAPVLAAGARVALRATVITRRAVLLALAERGVFAQMPAAARRGVSLQMAIGLRILPEADFAQLLTVLRRVGPMTKKEYDFVNFVLARVTYRSRHAMWLSIARKRIGRLRKGTFYPQLSTAHEPHELAAMQRLADASGETVVALPTVLPEHFGLPRPPEIKTVTYPDAVWGDELCELIRVEGKTAENALKKLGDKGLQANTVVVTVREGVSFTLADVEKEIPRLWGKPERAYLDRVVLLSDTTYKVITRPDRYLVPLVHSLTRGTVPHGEQLADIADAVFAEPDPITAPSR